MTPSHFMSTRAHNTPANPLYLQDMATIAVRRSKKTYFLFLASSYTTFPPISEEVVFSVGFPVGFPVDFRRVLSPSSVRRSARVTDWICIACFQAS